MIYIQNINIYVTYEVVLATSPANILNSKIQKLYYIWSGPVQVLKPTRIYSNTYNLKKRHFKTLKTG